MSAIVGIIPLEGGWSLRDEYPLVQSRCVYNVVDVYTIAEIVQDYHSNAPLNRDVEYVFPLPPSAAVCSFKAVIDEKVVKGVVKEKSEAMKTFKQAVAKGKTAGLLQQEHADVFRVSLGNIKPNTKISVHITFVSIVPHDGSSPQTLRVTLPTAIAPRYGATPTNIPWFATKSQNRFELSVSIQMNKPITSISSPSHPIGLTLGCHQRELTGDYNPAKAFVYLAAPAMLDEDIVVIISAQGLDTPRCSVERWLESDGAEETTDAYALTLVPKFDLPALPCQEYIFLVDRSGSMSGGRITAVKAALQILLRSLPSRNTRFNIVSFGSDFTSLWPESQQYTADSMEEASKHVDGFDANYGGTELLSALKFAFGSRQDVKPAPTAGGEKIPTSVFVLTDGEAWDLEGIVEAVANNCEAAKNSGSLLRAFVLGVGNQVSIAMCEGIARAGKGTAVFVAEREKPDAKLMGLLKAARGGVVDDLAVHWVDEDSRMDEDDDFEMVPRVPTPTPPVQAQEPLNLYDEHHTETPAEIGAQQIKVVLGSPPRVQQAPKSDKLPIPLYPGFRCSIFAIIRQPKNPGPHSAAVKITGKMLGRDVVLQIPVSPMSVNLGVTRGEVEGGNLIHVLAAKALIQAFEDLPSTPESKAQIERLGKRYSLASSATSFVAIDGDEEYETTPLQPQEEELVPDVYGLAAVVAYPDEDEDGCEDGEANVGYFMQAMQEESDEDMGFGLWDGEDAPVAPGGAAAFAAAPVLAVSAFTSDSFSPTSPGYGPQSFGYSSAMPQNFHSASPGYSPSSPQYSPTTTFTQSSSIVDAAPSVPKPAVISNAAEIKLPPPPPPPLRTLTVDSIARAQRFDGSFPYDLNHFIFIFEGREALATSALQLPPLLSSTSANEADKMTIWVTIVTLACLQQKFASEKDAWELLAEKAQELVVGLLADLGLSESKTQEVVAKLADDAIPLF